MKKKVLALVILLNLFAYQTKAAWGLNMFPDADLTIVLINAKGQVEVLPAGVYTLILSGDNNGLHTYVTQNIGVPSDSNVSSSYDKIQLGGYKISVRPGIGILNAGVSCVSSDSLNTFSLNSPDEININIQVPRSSTTCTFEFRDGYKRAPVLIVPGVLGSELSYDGNLLWANAVKMANPLNDDSFMDPMGFSDDLKSFSMNVIGILREKNIGPLHFDYSQGLIEEFLSQGYTEGQDLFTFPYDWRYGVSGLDASGEEVNVDALKGQIDYILNQTDAGKSAGKVDIVAHSTGGLIVKKYVQEHPTDHHIGKAIFVGVPNLGAPKAFKALIVGDNFGVPGLNDNEMKKLAQNMPVVYDLAPSAKYAKEIGSFVNIQSGPDLSYGQALSLFQSQNLINVTAAVNSFNLHSEEFDNYDLRDEGIDSYNVLGCKVGTFGKFTEVEQPGAAFYYDFPKVMAGDGTVPLASAQSNPANSNNTYFVPNVDHGHLLSANGARQEIVNLISGSSLNTSGKIVSKTSLDSNPSLCKLKGKSIKIFSPLSISITDQDGNQSQVLDDDSIQNDIPGADYEVFGEHKFVYLPYDDGQTYSIQVTGTGTGTFTLVVDDIDNDDVISTQSFENVPVTTGETGTLSFDHSSPVLQFNNVDLVPGDYTPIPVTAGGGSYVVPPSGIVLGANKNSPPDTSLVLDASDNRTVYIICNGKKYGFTSDNIFLGFGFSFAHLIGADLSGVESGGLIDSNDNHHPEGSLIIENGTIWLIKDNIRYGVPNMDLFNAHGFDKANIVPINSYDKSLETKILE